MPCSACHMSAAWRHTACHSPHVTLRTTTDTLTTPKPAMKSSERNHPESLMSGWPVRVWQAKHTRWNISAKPVTASAAGR